LLKGKKNSKPKRLKNKKKFSSRNRKKRLKHRENKKNREIKKHLRLKSKKLLQKLKNNMILNKKGKRKSKFWKNRRDRKKREDRMLSKNKLRRGLG